MPRDDDGAVFAHGPDLRSLAADLRHDRPAGVCASASGVLWGDLRAVASGADRQFPQAHGADSPAGAVAGRRGGASGGGGSDGGAIGPARGRGDPGGPCFAVEVGPDGYAWWYVDGVSDDGTRALSVIGFIGSVFSPWYAWSGRRSPQDHCCINLATYGPGGRFTMTDRGRAVLRQTADTLTVGPSRTHWTGRQLVIEINEWGAPPMVTPVRGTVVLTPAAITGVEVRLTPEGTYLWRPFAPNGTAAAMEPPPLTARSRTLWALGRETRADPCTRPRQVMAMLDAPFNSRSLVETRLNGETTTGVHEALDLNRFASPFLKPLLALRVPRRAGWTHEP